MTTLPALQIGQYTARYPIIQGGMGIRISGAKLAAAVANAGGIGIISAVGLGLNSPYFDPNQKAGRNRREQFFEANRLALIDELNSARAISPEGIIGINIMVAAQDYETLVRTAVEHGANLIIAGAGLPLGLPAYTQDHPEVALVPIVSTTRAARLICQKWQRQHHRLPDAFIVENPQTAGGHLGAKLEDLNSPRLAAKEVIPALTNYLQDRKSVKRFLLLLRAVSGTEQILTGCWHWEPAAFRWGRDLLPRMNVMPIFGIRSFTSTPIPKMWS